MSLKGTAIPTTGTEILELQPFLKYLADCIRTKKETTEPINAQDFGKEILKISGGANLNIEYADTPPSDTSKLWLNCNEPSGVEIQNYLGECAVSNVLEYGTIGNPTTSSYFYYSYFSTCYIGNNQIAIVGYNHIRIFDLTTKSYIADYSISVGTRNYYTSNILYKDNILYFGYRYDLYSFDLTTQTLTKLKTYSSDYSVYYLFFNNESEIGILTYYSSNVDRRGSFYILNIETNTQNAKFVEKVYCRFSYLYTSGVKIGDYIYNFSFINDSYMKAEMNSKFNLSTYTFDTLTSFSNFMTSLGWTQYYNSSTVYDNEKYVYIIGGYGTYNGTTTKSDLIIRYDIVNDSFELLDSKLLGEKYQHFSILVDNRVYMFGGSSWTTNNISYGRTNYIDYFDLKYPLNENNAIVTTNTINTDVMVNLINEDTIKLKSNVASAYIGNADNLAEKVNAYYHNGNAWLGINTDNPFIWKTVEDQVLFLGETKTFEVSYTNNLNWEMTYGVTSDLTVSNNSNTLTINAGSTVGTYPITVTANSSEYNSVYEKTFNVITNNAITWTTIPNQTSTSSNSITLDLSTYYTNNSSYDVTLNASSSDNTNFEVSITGNTLTVNCLAVANTTITIEAIVLGITYSVSFNLTAS